MLKIDLNGYAKQAGGPTAEDPPGPDPPERVIDFNGKKLSYQAAPPPPGKPKLKIEKMERCLHGRSCRYLKSDPPASPLCDKAGVPVWDLIECPIMNWAPKQPKLKTGGENGKV